MHCRAAIDIEAVSGDEARARTRQKHYRGRNLLRPADTTERIAGFRQLQLQRKRRKVQEWRVRRPRCDRVDENMRSQFACQSAGEGHHSALGRTIRRSSSTADVSEFRGNVDDACYGAQMWQTGADHQQRTAQVDGIHFVEVGDLECFERRIERDAGTIHHDIEAPVFVGRDSDGSGNVLFRSDVGFQNLNAIAYVVQIKPDDPCTGVLQRVSSRKADTTGRAVMSARCPLKKSSIPRLLPPDWVVRPEQHFSRILAYRQRRKGFMVGIDHIYELDKLVISRLARPKSTPDGPKQDTQLFRRLDLNLFRVFREITRAKGIGAAARRLNVRQPAVSLALQRLEAHIGAPLCTRTPHGIELTAAGRVVAGLCEHLFQEVQSIPNAVASAVGQIEGC